MSDFIGKRSFLWVKFIGKRTFLVVILWENAVKLKKCIIFALVMSKLYVVQKNYKKYRKIPIVRYR